MSTPRSLELPSCAAPRRIVTSRLDHATLVASSADPSVSRRGTAVLVPGFTGSKEDFLAVLEPLAAGGYDVVTYDQRGQFETAVGDEPLDDILEVLATDLVALIDAVSPDAPVHLVGHSMGGLVSRAATLRAPQQVASLTLLCSGPAALPEEQRPLLQALAVALESVDLEQVWQAKEMIDRTNNVPMPPPDVHAFMHERFVMNAPQAVRAKALLLTAEVDRSPQLAAVASSCGTRLLVITGADDDAWPVAQQAEMAATLHATHALISGAGHSPAVDEPAATAEILLDFWAGEQG